MEAFAKEVFSYEFTEKPNYNKLRFLLEKNLLDHEIIPDNNFDWNTNENECVDHMKRKQEEAKHISAESKLFQSHEINEFFFQKSYINLSSENKELFHQIDFNAKLEMIKNKNLKQKAFENSADQINSSSKANQINSASSMGQHAFQFVQNEPQLK